MTGGELIKFIQENKLEDFEIKECEADCREFMFGDIIKLDDGRELCYFVGTPMKKNSTTEKQGVIEIFNKRTDGWMWTHPTTEEALKLRGL